MIGVPVMDARRAGLVAEMHSLQARGIDCRTCSGVCCTAAANSMQIDAAQAQTLLNYLKQAQLWTEALQERLQACVVRYGLDRPPVGDGRRTFTRRTYTCPFFAGGPLGCSLPPAAKPYGCLAFNPHRSGLVDGGDCATSQTHQKTVDNPAASLPIPLALLTLDKTI